MSIQELGVFAVEDDGHGGLGLFDEAFDDPTAAEETPAGADTLAGEGTPASGDTIPGTPASPHKAERATPPATPPPRMKWSDLATLETGDCLAPALRARTGRQEVRLETERHLAEVVPIPAADQAQVAPRERPTEQQLWINGCLSRCPAHGWTHQSTFNMIQTLTISHADAAAVGGSSSSSVWQGNAVCARSVTKMRDPSSVYGINAPHSKPVQNSRVRVPVLLTQETPNKAEDCSEVHRDVW